MTISNWIEIGVIVITLLTLGIPLIKATKKVSDLEGADLVTVSTEESDCYSGSVISSK